MENNKNQVFEFVKKNGPILPAQVAKEFKMEILFAGAVLSELVANKKVFVSNTKKGGSPFYYTLGQESKLQDLSEFLKGRVREAYEIIKEKKLLRDASSEPWLRVALREIKDFALLITVKRGEDSELFWKWYLSSEDDVKKLLGEPKVEAKPEKKFDKQKYLDEMKEKVREEKKEDIGRVVKEEKKVVETVENYYSNVLKFFGDQQIYVISKDIVRKNREFNFVVDVPSGLGNLRYFVKFNLLILFQGLL